MNKFIVPALQRGLKLLELIADNGEIGFSKLEQISKLNSNSLNRLLKQLMQNGYIQKNQNTKYILEPKLFALTNKQSIWQVILDKTSEILYNICHKYKVTALIYAYTPNGIMVLNKIVHPDNIAMRKIGEIRKDYLLSPWGYIYISHLDDEKRVSFVKQAIDNEWSKQPPPNMDTIQYFIKYTLENGYCDDQGKLCKKMRRIGVPIYGNNNDLIGVLAIGTFVSFFNDEEINDITECLKQNAKRIIMLIET